MSWAPQEPGRSLSNSPCASFSAVAFSSAASWFSVRTKPSWATLASSALRRFFIVSRSWRCHTPRTPAGPRARPPARWSAPVCASRWRPGSGRRRAAPARARGWRLDLGRRAVRQQGLTTGQLLKGELAAGVVELLEAGEAVARGAHHLAGLAHVAELLGELQKAHFGPDDLLLLGHGRCPLKRRGWALRPPPAPRPASALA